MTLPIYCETDTSTLKPGLYLCLFHGREDIDQYMDDRGENGPMIGPIKYAHTTYGNEIKVEFESHEDWLKYFPGEPKVTGFRYAAGFFYQQSSAPTLDWVQENPEEAKHHPAVGEIFYATEAQIEIARGEMVVFGDKYYGDWTVYNVQHPRHKD